MKKHPFYKELLIFIGIYILSIFLIIIFTKNHFITAFCFTFLIMVSYESGYRKSEGIYNPEDDVIISEFGKILETYNNQDNTPIIPGYRLPYPKDKIRQALKRQVEVNRILNNKEKIDALNTGISFLDNLIDDKSI